jgi:hypothetical protein
LIAIARPLYVHDPIGIDLDQSLYALDFTTIDLCISLISVGEGSPTQSSCQDAQLDGVHSGSAESSRHVFSAHGCGLFCPSGCRYWHDDRTHLGLGKEIPGERLRSVSNGQVIGCARLRGLPHRYDRAAYAKSASGEAPWHSTTSNPPNICAFRE